MTAIDIMNGRDANQTVEFYHILNARGPAGRLATALLRASKCSGMAKGYRKRKYQVEVYRRKQWSIRECEKILAQYAGQLNIRYGWLPDYNRKLGGKNAKPFLWVFYVDTPFGQVSFHDPERGTGPDYPGEWDGMKGESVKRIVDYCDWILFSD